MNDKLVAATAGMAAVLYLLAACIAWYRVLSPTFNNRASRYVYDRAIAWTALCVVFARIVGVRLRLIDWSNDHLDIALATSLLAVWLCGIDNVRAFTYHRFGWNVWALVVIVSAATGIAIILA